MKYGVTSHLNNYRYRDQNQSVAEVEFSRFYVFGGDNMSRICTRTRAKLTFLVAPNAFCILFSTKSFKTRD